MPKKIEERKFVAFGYAVIDKDLIVAVVGGVKKIGGAEQQVVLVMLETNAHVTLTDDAMDMFLFWWVENMKEHVEKIDLPEPVQPKSVPSELPPPEPVVEKVETVEAVIPNIVSEVAAEVAPTPPPTDPPLQPPSLSDIGKT